MTTVTAELPDFKHAPNQGGNIGLYEVENRALDPDGHVLAALRARASWAGRALLDLGCGSGYWLSGYADEAAEVIGVEPDPRLLPLAAGRDPRVRVLRGSAERHDNPASPGGILPAREACRDLRRQAMRCRERTGGRPCWPRR